jgi:hypothetical protein
MAVEGLDQGYRAFEQRHDGRLDPKTGKSDMIALGSGAAPHGVIVGPDGECRSTSGNERHGLDAGLGRRLGLCAAIRQAPRRPSNRDNVDPNNQTLWPMHSWKNPKTAT